MIGLVWLVYALLFPLNEPLHYGICAFLSGAAFVVGKALFPDKVYQTPSDKEKDIKAKQQAAKKEQTSEDPQVAALIKEKDRAISEMRRLNDAIEDARISAQIDHMEEVTGKILDAVIAQPKKQPQIRRFLDYYLPTTLKLLNAYDRMDSAGIDGQNITTTKAKVEKMLDTICQAFDKQLDALYGEEALDISTDITVMENLLAQEGFGAMDLDRPDDGGGIRLEL